MNSKKDRRFNRIVKINNIGICPKIFQYRYRERRSLRPFSMIDEYCSGEGS